MVDGAQERAWRQTSHHVHPCRASVRAFRGAPLAACFNQCRGARDGPEATEADDRCTQSRASDSVSEDCKVVNRLGALFSVALACGLRLGEACGLLWDDLNLDTGEIRIRQQLQKVGKSLVLQPLKTAKSRRSLVLPNVCIQALREHRKRQLKERLKAGAAWVDTGLVFTTYAPRGDKRKRGTRLHPRNVVRVLHGLCDSAEPKIQRVRFHDLRHSAASLLIASGVELAEVSMLLGHALSFA